MTISPVSLLGTECTQAEGFRILEKSKSQLQHPQCVIIEAKDAGEKPGYLTKSLAFTAALILCL